MFTGGIPILGTKSGLLSLGGCMMKVVGRGGSRVPSDFLFLFGLTRRMCGCAMTPFTERHGASEHVSSFKQAGIRVHLDHLVQ